MSFAPWTRRRFLAATAVGGAAAAAATPPAAGGWHKDPANPVLGGNLGTCFDVAVLPAGAGYRMWFSWRPRKSIASTDSPDGVRWSPPVVVLGPAPATGWEDDINRPVVLQRDGAYQMWYTGQARGRSAIGFATSPDGRTWTRQSAKPVLVADRPWEKVAVMCPHVVYDGAAKEYRMWYSGGEQYEPNAIGHATSPDGRAWTKPAANPVFRPDPGAEWEKDRVTACHVLRHGDWWVMFYIGFRDVHRAAIGLARSRDGLSGWERHPLNPVLRPDPGAWDGDAVYKPAVLFDGRRWRLWYNGRRGSVEQIGLATRDGADLGF